MLLRNTQAGEASHMGKLLGCGPVAGNWAKHLYAAYGVHAAACCAGDVPAVLPVTRPALRLLLSGSSMVGLLMGCTSCAE